MTCRGVHKASRYGAAAARAAALPDEGPPERLLVDGTRGFGAADQAIEVFENLVSDAVRAVCEGEVCEQWCTIRDKLTIIIICAKVHQSAIHTLGRASQGPALED